MVKKSSRIARDLKFLESVGLGISREAVNEALDNTAEKRALAQEAMLKTLALKPPRLVQRECSGCGDTFGTNYLYVAYCGESCRRKALRDVGIEYNPIRDTYEPSKREEPMIVPQDALMALRELLSTVVSSTTIRIEPDLRGSSYNPNQGVLFDFETVPTGPSSFEYDLRETHRRLGIRPTEEPKKRVKNDAVLAEAEKLLADLGI